MDNTKTNLPPLRQLHSSLRKITEQIAGELSRPGAGTPDWSEREWRLAKAVAALHGVSPLLATRLEWNGPEDWKRFLTGQRAHVAARQQRIEELLGQLDARAREEDIALVGLKGAALHAIGLYRAGERPMADIDLLVHPDQAERATRMLESLGYSERFANWKHKVFMPEAQNTHASIGEHGQNYLKIELHERIAEILPFRVTDITAAVLPRHPHPGVNGYPSKAALLTHLLIHAAGAIAYRAVRLLHLHDIALVSSRMTPSDWNELLTHRSASGGPWWALPPLQLTAKYYETVVPSLVMTALADGCQWNLRRIARHQSLSDASLSYLWVEAFPGIGWSRSIAEVLEYIGSRIRPDTQTLKLRQVAADTQVAIAHSPWGRMSQGQRLLRWLTARQARADTLYAVSRALGRGS